MTDSKSSDVGRDLILTVFPIKSKSEPPQKRCGHSFNIIGNTGYVYGGAASDMLLADLYTVDLSNNNPFYSFQARFASDMALFF